MIKTNNILKLTVIIFLSLFFLLQNFSTIYATMSCGGEKFSTDACKNKSYGSAQSGCPSDRVCGIIEGTVDSRCVPGGATGSYVCKCFCVKPDQLQSDVKPPVSSPFFSFDFEIPNPTQFESLEEVISALGALLQPIFIITFAAMILYGAWVRLNSRGDAAKVEQSTKIIIAAIIGFSIAVFAPTIVNIVASILGVSAKLE